MQKLKHKRLYLEIILTAFMFLNVFNSVSAAAVPPACQPFAGDKSALEQCMKETPPGCLDINRDTRAGEEKFDSCSAEKVLSKNNAIVKKLNEIVDFLSAGVALVIVGSIIFGGVQYAMAGGSPEAVGKAKERITNAVIALVVYIFIFSFLQWIIPGGIFNS